jgi:sensor histidine kinase YesM
MQLIRAARWRRLQLIFLAWAGTSVFFTAVLLVSDLGGRKPFSFALYANAVHFALWTALLPLIARSANLFPISGKKKRWNAMVLVLIVALLAPLVALCHWAIVYSTYFPYRSIYPSFRALLQSELIRFMPVDTLIGIVMVVAFAGRNAWKALQEERARSGELERQLAVARLEALRTQLHPHFLFNTLHNVAGLTMENPTVARSMVIALGDLLRTTLKATGDRLWTVGKELEYSDLYLGIEKLRLGDRLVLHYDIDPSATRALVPQFLLQPLFENAIRHGAERIAGPCEIRFSGSQQGDSLNVVIQNDGPGRDPSSATPSFGVGLTNVLNRLRIYYADHHSFEFSDLPAGGVRIRMSIPYRVSEEEESPRMELVANEVAECGAAGVARWT